MSRWVDLAEDRLAGTGIQCIFAPGNDDPLFVDDVLGSSSVGDQPGRPGGRAARRLPDDLGRLLEPDAMGLAARARRGGPGGR